MRPRASIHHLAHMIAPPSPALGICNLLSGQLPMGVLSGQLPMETLSGQLPILHGHNNVRAPLLPCYCPAAALSLFCCCTFRLVRVPNCAAYCALSAGACLQLCCVWCLFPLVNSASLTVSAHCGWCVFPTVLLMVHCGVRVPCFHAPPQHPPDTVPLMGAGALSSSSLCRGLCPYAA